MKWLLVFLPFWVKAQCLKPGTYHNLKPTEPLVLDTGTYTFIHLEMKDLNSGTWLDARKARKLELIGCSFIGNGEGTAVVGSGDLVVSSSVFSRLACAVHFQAIGHRQVKVYRNTFTDNDTAIALHPADKKAVAQVSFALKCNEFDHSSHSSGMSRVQTGLFIGPGIRPGYTYAGIFMAGHIGGEGRYFADGFSYPNGNLWPTAKQDRSQRRVEHGMFTSLHHPDPTIAWPNGRDWVAIDNQSGMDITYSRYESEFVGWGEALRGVVRFTVPEEHRMWRLQPGQVTDSCTYKVQQPNGQANPMVCEQLVDEQPFLLPTHWQMLPAGPEPAASGGKPWMAEMGDGPHRGEVRLRIWLPPYVEHAVLQYLAADGGEVLQTNPIDKRGWMEAHLDLRYTDPGAYLCRLVANGKPGNPQNLIIIR